jgi:hypothetical protein
MSALFGHLRCSRTPLPRSVGSRLWHNALVAGEAESMQKRTAQHTLNRRSTVDRINQLISPCSVMAIADAQDYAIRPSLSLSPLGHPRQHRSEYHPHACFSRFSDLIATFPVFHYIKHRKPQSHCGYRSATRFVKKRKVRMWWDEHGSLSVQHRRNGPPYRKWGV